MELNRKDLDFEIRQVEDPENRVLEFVGSTADVDRYGDIIEVAGWDYRNYMAKGHGPFLWAHNYDAPPVGKTIEVSKEEKGLVFRVYFPTPEWKDMRPGFGERMADAAIRLLKELHPAANVTAAVPGRPAGG